jgi:hypothetical protein
MTEFTGAANCAECGSGFTSEIILAGGSEPATVKVRGHAVPIPGLYRCGGCHAAVQLGMRPTRVTLESAAEWLDGTFGPQLVGVVMMAPDRATAGQAAERLADVMEVSIVLEAVIQLQAEPGGLDFIPECAGGCGTRHPSATAHLN